MRCGEKARVGAGSGFELVEGDVGEFGVDDFVDGLEFGGVLIEGDEFGEVDLFCGLVKGCEH